MALIEVYAELRLAHIGLAAGSVALFVARGVAVLAGQHWPMSTVARWTSVAIDTLLIGAGGTLWWMLSLHPARNPWLGVKLGLIVVYIVLGSLALKRAPSRSTKAVAFAAALICIGAVAAIARAHDPTVIWRGLRAAG